MRHTFRMLASLALMFSSYSMVHAAESAGQKLTPAESRPSAAGPADFFTGRVRVDPLSAR